MANLSDVLDFIRNPDLDPGDLADIVEALKAQTKAIKSRVRAGLRPGQKVRFFSAQMGCDVVGTLTKVCRVNVQLTDTFGHRWRVAPQLLRVI